MCSIFERIALLPVTIWEALQYHQLPTKYPPNMEPVSVERLLLRMCQRSDEVGPLAPWLERHSGYTLLAAEEID